MVGDKDLLEVDVAAKTQRLAATLRELADAIAHELAQPKVKRSPARRASEVFPVEDAGH